MQGIASNSLLLCQVNSQCRMEEFVGEMLLARRNAEWKGWDESCIIEIP